MTQTSAFKNSEGEAAFLAAYDSAMNLWPVPYEEVEVPGRFGRTHVVVSGPKDAPPLVLLHGYSSTLTMWSPNIADFSKDYRVYALDMMGQPGKTIPDPNHPLQTTNDLVAWLNETLDMLKLDRVFLVGMSYGGWSAINLALSAPERIQKLVLLSPAASFQPIVRQFGLRLVLMMLISKRFTADSLMSWMGITDKHGDMLARYIRDLFYLGMKHFRLQEESMRLMPEVFSDNELRALRMPVLLLIGENEVIYNPAKALARALQFIPALEGELVPRSKHDMCSSQYKYVDMRVLEFLNGNK